MITTLDKEGERIMLTQTGRLTLAAKKWKRKDRILKLIHPIVLKGLSTFRKYSLQIEGTIPNAQSRDYFRNKILLPLLKSGRL